MNLYRITELKCRKPSCVDYPLLPSFDISLFREPAFSNPDSSAGSKGVLLLGGSAGNKEILLFVGQLKGYIFSSDESRALGIGLVLWVVPDEQFM